MKIIKYIAIGLCVLFTIADLSIKFAEWSGLSVWLNSTAVCTKGGVIYSIVLMGALCFTAGFDAARSKYEKKLLDVSGRDY